MRTGTTDARIQPGGTAAMTDAGMTGPHDSVIGVRADLVRAVMQVESAFNPNARSPKGALGLMQLMPATIRQFGVSNPFSPSRISSTRPCRAVPS